MNSYTTPHAARAALLTIDVQNDVLDAGAFAVPGTSAVLPTMEKLLTAFRSAGRSIVHVVRLYSPSGANVDLCRRAAFEDGFRALCPGTDGAELATPLRPRHDARLDTDLLLRGDLQELGPREHVIYKPRWGAFYSTKLDAHLRAAGVDTIVLLGANFPNCPRTTLYEASERDYRTVMIVDAVSGVYDRGIDELHRIGVEVMSADAWLALFMAPMR